jgi:hypothetical protein
MVDHLNNPTPDEIRRRGLAALRRELGRRGMIRFLQQFEKGSGDYAKDCHAWVDEVSLEDIRASAKYKRAKKK